MCSSRTSPPRSRGPPPILDCLLSPKPRFESSNPTPWVSPRLWTARPRETDVPLFARNRTGSESNHRMQHATFPFGSRPLEAPNQLALFALLGNRCKFVATPRRSKTKSPHSSSAIFRTDVISSAVSLRNWIFLTAPAQSYVANPSGWLRRTSMRVRTSRSR